MSGLLGAQDTFYAFYVGNMKGVGRIYQQTFIDTYAKVAFAKRQPRASRIRALSGGRGRRTRGPRPRARKRMASSSVP